MKANRQVCFTVLRLSLGWYHLSSTQTLFMLTELRFSGNDGKHISRFNPSCPLVSTSVATAMFFYDLYIRLTVTSLPRLASANTCLVPSLLPTSQILASTGWLVIGQSPTCSSYQIVLKITQHKNLISKTCAKPPHMLDTSTLHLCLRTVSLSKYAKWCMKHTQIQLSKMCL